MTDEPIKNGGKTGKGRFEPGNAGGPGRPEGRRNRATEALQALLDGEGEKITRKAVERALEGDSVALRLCMERLVPPRKSRAIELDLPAIETADDLVKGMSAVITATARGEITPEEATTVAGILELKRKAIETLEHDRRLAALEQAQGVGR